MTGCRSLRPCAGAWGRRPCGNTSAPARRRPPGSTPAGPRCSRAGTPLTRPGCGFHWSQSGTRGPHRHPGWLSCSAVRSASFSPCGGRKGPPEPVAHRPHARLFCLVPRNHPAVAPRLWRQGLLPECRPEPRGPSAGPAEALGGSPAGDPGASIRGSPHAVRHPPKLGPDAGRRQGFVRPTGVGRYMLCQPVNNGDDGADGDKLRIPLPDSHRVHTGLEVGAVSQELHGLWRRRNWRGPGADAANLPQSWRDRGEDQGQPRKFRRLGVPRVVWRDSTVGRALRPKRTGQARGWWP